MKNIHLHTVTVKIGSYDILSADTEFYAYVRRDRLYDTFEKFIHLDCRDRFLKIVEERNEDPFVINMVDDEGGPLPTFMQIKYESDRMSVTLESVYELKEGQQMYKESLDIARDLMGLHNDLIFIYDEDAKEVKYYTPDLRRCTKTLTFQEFTDSLRSNVKKNELDRFDRFLMSLKTASGSFTYTFTGNIVEPDDNGVNSVVKGFNSNSDDSLTYGYIHRSSNKAKASFTVERDALTGVYSKQEIANMARKAIEVDHQQNIAICIVDIDYFKRVNDCFGHMTGDRILREVAEILSNEVGNSGSVGRFGGDEFFIMFYDVEDMELCREKLRSIKNIVNTKYPKTDDENCLSVTLSIGCAVYPKNADNYDDLFTLADFCLYRAKDKGRNRYIIYEADLHGSLEEIKDYSNNYRRIDSRKNMAMGDVICMITDKHYDDDSYTPEMLADDLVENLQVDRIICLTGEPLRYRCMSGINLYPVEVINANTLILQTDKNDKNFKDNMLVINDIEMIKNFDLNIYQAYKDMEVKSFILVAFKDAVGKPSLVSFEMTSAKVTWNTNQLYNYRTIARMFAKYEL